MADNLSIEKLTSLPLFKDQEKKVLKDLAGILKEKQYPRGIQIFTEGAFGDALYVILSGEVLITKIVNRKTGETKPLALLREGDFFGEMALIEDKPRSASAVAKGEVQLLCLAKEDFQQLLLSKPAVAAKMLFSLINQLSARLRQASREVSLLFETGRIIGSRRNLQEMGNLILDRLLEVISSSEAGFLALENEFSQEYEIIAARGLPAELTQALQPEDSLVGHFLKTRSEYILSEEGKRYLPGYDSRGLPPRSILAVPLTRENKLFGLIVLLNFKREGVFRQEDLQLLSAVASQVTSAVSLGRYQEEERARERLARAREEKVF